MGAAAVLLRRAPNFSGSSTDSNAVDSKAEKYAGSVGIGVVSVVRQGASLRYPRLTARIQAGSKIRIVRHCVAQPTTGGQADNMGDR